MRIDWILCAFAMSLPAQDPVPAFELADGDRVVFLGNTFAEREALNGCIETALTRRFPGRRISFRNLGWSGDSVDVQLRPSGFPPLETWLEQTRPTVVFAAFGMNESHAGEAGIDAFARALDAFLDRLAPTKARVVLLSPIRHEALAPPFADPADHNRALKLYVEALRSAAARRKLAFVDLFESLKDWPFPLTENGIHLNAHGYARAARAIEGALGLLPLWKLQIDASGKVSPAGGAAVDEPHFDGTTLRFKVTKKTLSMEDRPLKVTGLSPGRWVLKAGGVSFASGSAEEWAMGVDVSSGPTEELRRAIVQKNELYFHRWRPQNAEYIYGTRSRAQGANVGNPQFASEFRLVESLVEEREKEIHALVRPVAETWELSKQP